MLAGALLRPLTAASVLPSACTLAVYTCCDHNGTHGDRVRTTERCACQTAAEWELRAARSGASQLARQRGALLLSVDLAVFQQRGAVLLSLRPPTCCDHSGTLPHRVRSHPPTRSAGIGFGSASDLTCRDARAVHMTRCLPLPKRKM